MLAVYRLIRTGVSGKTDYLLVGSVLEDGRPLEEGSKYKTAVQKKVKIITEDQLFELINATAPHSSLTNPAVGSPVASQVSSPVPAAPVGPLKPASARPQPMIERRDG
jgi:replication factor C subunit 1